MVCGITIYNLYKYSVHLAQWYHLMMGYKPETVKLLAPHYLIRHVGIYIEADRTNKHAKKHRLTDERQTDRQCEGGTYL